MDTQKQVDYWVNSADEDFAAAQSLLEKGHFRHCLFFAHLAIEKMLKAHVAKQTKDVPPRIHNFVSLAKIAGLSLDVDREQLLSEFEVYQLEGRYPDRGQLPLNTSITRKEISKAKEIMKWLKAQL